MSQRTFRHTQRLTLGMRRGMMLELYHFYGATCGLKARLAVAEKDLNVIDRAVDRAYLKTSEYLALNPNGVVPTLVHDGQVLTESSVIINYLDDLSAMRPLKPAGAIGAARAFWWMKRGDDCLPFIGILTYTVSMRPALMLLEPPALTAYLEAIRNPTLRTRRSRIIELGCENPEYLAALAAIRSMLADMEQTLSRTEWLAGVEYSLADTAITPLLERLEELNLGDVFRAGRPKVSGWWERIRARPSYDACVVQKPNPDAAQHRHHGEAASSQIARAMSA